MSRLLELGLIRPPGYARWQRRDLSARRYVYVWADGVYLQARMEPQAECILVLIGATPEGEKERVGSGGHAGERTELAGTAGRPQGARIGLAPELATGDGALGFWKAVQRQLSCPVGDDCGGRLGGFTGDGRDSRRGLCDRRF